MGWLVKIDRQPGGFRASSGSCHPFRLAQHKTACNVVLYRRPTSLICDIYPYRQHGEYSILFEVEKCAGATKWRQRSSRVRFAAAGCDPEISLKDEELAESSEIEAVRVAVQRARLETEKRRLDIEAMRSAVRVWVTYALNTAQRSTLGIVLCLASALRDGFRLERRGASFG